MSTTALIYIATKWEDRFSEDALLLNNSPICPNELGEYVAKILKFPYPNLAIKFAFIGLMLKSSFTLVLYLVLLFF